MSERRATITRAWRAPAAPARRHTDTDFVEVTTPPAARVPHQVAPTTELARDRERRDIGSRLENWARWCTHVTGGRAAASQTGAICERMRKAVEGSPTTASDRRAIDEDDALRLERGMRDLETVHRLLLWWCYIRQAPPEVVCRKMSIPHKPATEFVNLFRQAQAAIESIVEKNMERPI